jgi:H+-transporting ATPase
MSQASPVAQLLSPVGLTSAEAERRLAAQGGNVLPDVGDRPLARVVEKFWSPVPWLLEGALVMEVALGKYVEGAVIGVLLLLNAGVGFVQEGRAQATLAALKSRLAVTASARRDGVWRLLPAADIVVGDFVKLTLGGLVPADARIHYGEILVDQSMLTGESVPVEAVAGATAYAGALIRRGEAVAEVMATGVRTKFGKTADLVRTAHVVSTQQKTVFAVVRNIAVCNGVMIVGMGVYAYILGRTSAELTGLILTGILASIPVALPATFTLAAALGARSLAGKGVLPTRLSAVDEAGTMDVLCADKTGTLTRNALQVGKIQPLGPFSESHVLAMAAFASAEGGQDPVDLAIKAKCATTKGGPSYSLVKFTPFDPALRMSEALVSDAAGASLRVVKGAFASVAALAAPSPGADAAERALEAEGLRVMAVAAGPATALKLIGLIALTDPPREDSAALVAELHGLGVPVVMITGDAPVTALAVARTVGLEGALCPPGGITDKVGLGDYGVFAGVAPEDKFKLVKAYQAGGHTVGMCGDGANDAPALRQAQIGIAVSTATDVAKSAAGMVLTQAGLGGVVSAVHEGRLIFQRVVTYTLNSITKKVVQVLYIFAGLVMTGHAVLTPLLMTLIMIVGDILGMSLATDNVSASAHPNLWRVGRLTAAGVFIGSGQLIFSVAVLALGYYVAHWDQSTLQSLGFLTIVCGNQATTYNNRTRRRIWSSTPSRWLIAATAVDLVFASVLAYAGIAIAPLPLSVIAALIAATVSFAFLIDFAKVPVFKRLAFA